MQQPLLKRIRRAIRNEFRRIRDDLRITPKRRHRIPFRVRVRRFFGGTGENASPSQPRRKVVVSPVKRIRKAIKTEFRRIGDDLRVQRQPKPKLPLRVRIRKFFRNVRDDMTLPIPKKSEIRKPPLSKRIRYFFKEIKNRYRIVFSRDYLIIALNSTVLFLASYFVTHLLSHLATGMAAYFSEISTTLHYTIVDFHIRYWNWTEEMVITVFSIPSIFMLLVAIAASVPFERRKNYRKRLLQWFKTMTPGQRKKMAEKQREDDIRFITEKRADHASGSVKKSRNRHRLSSAARLFLLWTVFHSLVYFFSGMFYGFLFHRRFSYVIWYAFNNYLFDALFALLSALIMVGIGVIFARQFFLSGRMYFNELTGSNRLQFIISQAIIPFLAGNIITTLLQIPKFDPALILLNLSMVMLLLPLPRLAVRSENILFDNHVKKVTVKWKWIGWSAVIILAILITIKIGIHINLSQPG